jgi:hypothetical protein
MLGRALATAGAILLSAMAAPASAQNESQPCNANGQAVAYGDVLAGCTIEVVADLDTFTFNAVPGEVLRLVLTRTGGSSIFLCTEIRGPNNTIFLPMTCGNFDRVLEPVSVAGIYQVVVSEQGNDGTLLFNLSLERLFPLRAAVPVAPGDVLTGLEINPVADLDTFTFNAAPGDVLRLILTRTGGSSIFLCTEIRGPNNTIFLPMTCGNFDRVLEPVSVAGIYQVVVSEQGNDGTLLFNLSLERLFPLRAPVPVPLGDVLTGLEINPVADLDTFIFTAAPGDVLRLILTRTGGSSIFLCTEIRGPDNTIFLQASCGNVDRVLEPVSVAGIYQVVVSEQGNDGTVVFNMSLSCLSGTCARRHEDRDFNGDGKSDILWRHTSGTVYEWVLNGTNIIGQGSPGGATSDWTIARAGDFNGDKKSDILWRHVSGMVYIWLLDGTSIIGHGSPGGAAADWAIAGVGDFNGDEKSDILWRHTSGTVYEWLLDATNLIGQGSPGGATSDWTIAGVGDFNGDEKSDILWRHTSGTVYEWLLDATNIIGHGSPGGPPSDWTIAGVGDFNGDKKSDILWRHTSGTVYEWLLDATNIIGHGSPGGPPSDWTIVRVGDFNGDRISDILWRHTSGTVYEWLLAGVIVVGQGSLGGVSTNWQIQ